MKCTKRLFLFAGYDSQGIVGPSLEYYVQALARYGDIVLTMDTDCQPGMLDRLSGKVLHAHAERHGEYDFGSYKRSYMWISGHTGLSGYDVCYLVNDSVFGPLADIGPYLEKMESLGTDAFGLVLNPHRRHPHLQSWFIGMHRKVFLSDMFCRFISGVTAQKDKNAVCDLYETGLTNLFDSEGFSYDALFRVKGKKIYNAVETLCRLGLPFIKKSAFTRHGGSLGRQIRHILENTEDKALTSAVISDTDRLYGPGYWSRLTSCTRTGTCIRYFRYMINKLFPKKSVLCR